ncbi:MAG: hypothetical protein M3T56_09870 [Chloroflexota bacterium]|nr:hypothetical protein [Chloroflexota bacterium]
MGDWTKFLDLAADWANRRNAALADADLGDGRTRRVDWAGRTFRLQVRAGRHGPRLELLPCHGSRWLSLFVLGFLSLWWLGFGGSTLAWLLRSLQAEISNPVEIGIATLALVAANLVYGLFVWCFVFDDDWSFAPHCATQRLNLLGLPVREWTYKVIDASDWPDRLVLRTTGPRDVAVRPSGWGPETDDALMPVALRRLIRRYLAIPPVRG